MFVCPNITIALLAIVISGCATQTREPNSPEFEKYAAQSEGVLSADLDPASAQSGTWSIVLTTIASGRMEHANLLLDAVQNKGGLPQAYIDDRSSGLVIAYGRYPGSDDPRAKSDLTRIRAITIDEGTPFVGAFLAPPSGDDLMGSNPNHDLRNVKSRLGEHAVYTLQIGVYGSDDYNDPSPKELAEYRRSAEIAVAELRREGDQAFYYHGATRSMVTVGVFSRDDHDASTTPPLESSILRKTREKFPNNTLNGLGIRETVRTEQGKMKRMQRSQLVEIPKR